ncbi:RIO1 family-domain-containing protein [Gloeopeniophorella convolvens]|nr:RIO1 family-domain-containing protein [Gloeopeniophorella convolvens]
MKLDATDLRYVTSDEFRVLTAVEMGSKNHEVVPSVLIAQISGLRNGGVNKILGVLAKRNLIAKVQNSKYDGYRLTYGGYDYLAMRTLSKRDSLYSVGNQIGVGKESDIYIVADAEGREMVLKLHRLGRVSFRAIKEKRDYMGKRKSASWMYMSRLAAQKEWAFLKVLHEHDFPVPRPIDQARHCILMEFIDSYPLRQIDEVPSPGKLYSRLMDLIVRFAHAGLIHGDFNEFNILIRRNSGEPVVIDFPQMVSTSHENAEWYFNRDVECIRTFFRRRFRYESAIYPRFKSTVSDGDTEGFRLDVVVEASGFGRREMKALEEYMDSVKETEPEEEGDSVEEDEEIEELEDDDEEDEERAQSGGEDPVHVAEVPGISTRRLERWHHDAQATSTAAVDPNPGSPRSRPTSPDSASRLADALEASLSVGNVSKDEIKDKAAIEAYKERARQKQKYHSKRGAQRIGRAKGSKAKQDTRVKPDKSGLWY